MTVIEVLARAICEADRMAPDPDAPILYKMKPAKAWEARVPLAEAQVEALRKAGYEIRHTSTVGS